MKKLIKENRQRINQELQDPEQRKYFSPLTYAAYRATAPAILEHAQGQLIDIGCGDMPYKEMIKSQVAQYDTIDIERRDPDVKFLGDIQNMDVLKDASYDSAVCLEVLEHVRNPFKALDEIKRVLKVNGTLVLSTPHLSRLHEEPHDYFRYTRYGLQALFDQTGFDVLSIVPRGGLFCFLGHQWSTLILCPVWRVPMIKQIFFFLNRWLCVPICYFLDKIFDRGKIFAAGYTVVARKRGS